MDMIGAGMRSVDSGVSLPLLSAAKVPCAHLRTRRALHLRRMRYYFAPVPCFISCALQLASSRMAFRLRVMEAVGDAVPSSGTRTVLPGAAWRFMQRSVSGRSTYGQSVQQLTDTTNNDTRSQHPTRRATQLVLQQKRIAYLVRGAVDNRTRVRCGWLKSRNHTMMHSPSLRYKWLF